MSEKKMDINKISKSVIQIMSYTGNDEKILKAQQKLFEYYAKIHNTINKKLREKNV